MYMYSVYKCIFENLTQHFFLKDTENYIHIHVILDYMKRKMVCACQTTCWNFNLKYLIMNVFASSLNFLNADI